MRYPSNLRVIAPLALAGSLILSAPVWAAVDGESWNPVVSERLIKLPANYLKKAVDHDFAKSALASAISDNRELTRLKTMTLQDLQSAIEAAEGELRVELWHQFLAEEARLSRTRRPDAGSAPAAGRHEDPAVRQDARQAGPQGGGDDAAARSPDREAEGGAKNASSPRSARST